jgi:CheY-like chemotaxis protein
MADYTILVIDYEPRSIERLCKPLELAGYTVEVAKDGKAGIVKFHEIEPAAVIIEAMLPKRHGFEVCKELKQTPHGNRCPVMIATSVYRGRRYRHQAMHLYSCDAYLEKPLTDEDLLSTLEKGLQDYAAARAAAGEESAAAMEIDTAPLSEEVPAETLHEDSAAGPESAPVSAEPGAAMEIDTAPLLEETATEPPAKQPEVPEPAVQAGPETSRPNGSPQPAPQASAEDSPGDDFDILDRLDSLLSDDPSKSSPSGSDK